MVRAPARSRSGRAQRRRASVARDRPGQAARRAARRTALAERFGQPARAARRAASSQQLLDALRQSRRLEPAASGVASTARQRAGRRGRLVAGAQGGASAPVAQRHARCAAPHRRRARAASSRQAWATASRWPHRLPLSTVDTYMRQQRRARLRVVPVEEVAAVARQRRQRGERRLQPRRAAPACRSSRTARAHSRRQQVQADVGGRGAVRHHVVRRGLQVVGRQVVVFGDRRSARTGARCRARCLAGRRWSAAGRARARRGGRGRLTHQVHSGDAAQSRHSTRCERGCGRAQRPAARPAAPRRQGAAPPVLAHQRRAARSWPAPAPPRRWSIGAGGAG